jgi:hypothetical protein
MLNDTTFFTTGDRPPGERGGGMGHTGSMSHADGEAVEAHAVKGHSNPVDVKHAGHKDAAVTR